MAGIFQSTFAALEIREFRILWLGTWLSFMAFFMSTIVQSVVAFELAGANTAVGSVVFAQGLTMMTLSPIGGALADRLPKRRVVASGQLVTAILFAVLCALVATGRITVLYLAAGSFVLGATFSFIGPSRQALVVESVPAERRGNAIALGGVANTGSRVVGPVLAGIFLSWSGVGAAYAYATMAGLYVLSAVTLLFLPKSRVPEGSGRPLGSDVLEGIRYVARTSRLRTVFLFYTLIVMFGFPHVTLLPGLLANALDHDPADVSLLFLLSAIGALSSSLTLARFADSPRAPLLFATMGGVFGAALVVLASAPSYPAAVACMLLVGVGSGGFQSLGSAVAVNASDPVLVGRVLSLMMLAFAGFGLMGLPVGVLADEIGERATLATLGSLVLVLTVALAVSLRK